MKKIFGLEKFSDYPRSRVLKAISLYESGAVKKNTRAGESLYFSVESNETHEVIYRIRQNKFMCDCKHFALKNTHCSHILAVRLLMENAVYNQSQKS